MQQQEQILYMQIRIMRLAAERWKRPLAYVTEVFRKLGLAQYIADDFTTLRTEGDEAVYTEIMEIVNANGGLQICLTEP